MSHPQDLIKTMTEHTSIRRYTEAPVTDEERSAVEDAVRAASSSCFLQLVSVVRITDPALRDAFARLSGNQPHVKSAPEFWVFCADLSRDVARCPDAKTGWTEQLMMGVHDVGIAAQSAMTALEALGLGGVFVGGIRNGIAEADRLLKLPQYVIPVLGLAFGHPAQKNEVKPRLPKSILFSENTYRVPASTEIDEYDAMMRNYYRHRRSGAKDVSWTETLKPVMEREQRPWVLDFLRSKGWAFR